MQEEEKTACRICLETTNNYDNPLISPCLCRGSQSHVHELCLNRWREINPRFGSSCQICSFRYRFSVRFPVIHDLLTEYITSVVVTAAIFIIAIIVDVKLMKKRESKISLLLMFLGFYAIAIYIIDFVENQHQDDFRFIILASDPTIAAIIGCKRLYYSMVTYFQYKFQVMARMLERGIEDVSQLHLHAGDVVVLHEENI